MRCDHCFTHHPLEEACTLLVGPPEEGLASSRMGDVPLRLVRQLGDGALGRVYLAEPPATGCQLAVKVLHPHLAAHPAVVARLRAEALLTRRIVHPNVARLIDVRQTAGGQHCVLLEYVEGTPLSHLSLPVPLEEAVALLSQALDGLEAAHAWGVVHRDLKPDNLVLARGPRGERCVKVLDFGMAGPLAAGFSEEEHAAGVVVGSPAWLAPELWARAEPDGRADLYALAVVGYRLVTGRLPFGGGGRRGEMLLGHPPVRPLPPHVIEERIPPAFSAVLLQALSLRPEERFATARAFRIALHEALRVPACAPGGASRRASSSWFRGRVEDPHDTTLRPVRVEEVGEQGMCVAWDGPLPPLGARLQAELSLNGWALACAGDVVRLRTPEEARVWGLGPGFLLLFAEPSEDIHGMVARAQAHAAEPAPDAELARLLSRASSCAEDPYALLALPPHADFAEVLQRAALVERRLEPFAQRPLPLEQRQALEALRERLEAARRTLGVPLARAGFDALRGNFRGVARCLAAGVPPSELERLRQAFLSTRPATAARARELFDEAIMLEAQRVLDTALARYAEALSVDPLNVSLHRYYHSLMQRLRSTAATEPVARGG
jgi:eukaryotic-like serine/threonine-protein kinase